MIIDWLVHLYPPITRKRRCAVFRTNPHPLRSWPFSKLSCWRFDFFPRKFAACSKPPSRDNYRKASYPRTQQRDQGASWTHDPAIRVVVKTMPFFSFFFFSSFFFDWEKSLFHCFNRLVAESLLSKTGGLIKLLRDLSRGEIAVWCLERLPQI